MRILEGHLSREFPLGLPNGTTLLLLFDQRSISSQRLLSLRANKDFLSFQV